MNVRRQEMFLCLSSVGAKAGDSHDFTVKFFSPIELDLDTCHSIGLVNLSIHYSRYNVVSTNNNIRYSPDGEYIWKKIIFPSGVYDYNDLNQLIKYKLEKDDYSKERISLFSDGSSFRVLIELDPNFEVDLTVSDLADLIGFDKKVVTASEYGTRLPNITNSVDAIRVHCNLSLEASCKG